MHIRKSRKVNIPIRIASIMICLVLFSVYMTSGMLARYATSGSASGSGRAAKINVAVEGSGDISFYEADGIFVKTSDGADTYTVKLTNKSEVAVRYTVELVFPAGVDYVTVTMDNVTKSPAEGRVIFAGADLIPGTGTATENLTFAITDAVYALDTSGWHDETDTNPIAMDDVDLDFDVLVTFTQID